MPQTRMGVSEATMHAVLDLRRTHLQQLGAIMAQRVSLERSWNSLSRTSTAGAASAHADKLLTARPA